MLDGMSGQGGVVRLNVQLEVIDQSVGPQKVQTSGRIRIILVGGRFFRFGLNVKLPLETDLLFVVDSHVQEGGEVIQLALHVGVQQRRIPFAPTPKRVAFSVELSRHIHRLLDLRGRIRKHIRIRTGRRSLLITRMRKKTGRAPKQLLAAVVLQLA